MKLFPFHRRRPAAPDTLLFEATRAVDEAFAALLDQLDGLSDAMQDAADEAGERAAAARHEMDAANANLLLYNALGRSSADMAERVRNLLDPSTDTAPTPPICGVCGLDHPTLYDEIMGPDIEPITALDGYCTDANPCEFCRAAREAEALR